MVNRASLCLKIEASYLFLKRLGRTFKVLKEFRKFVRNSSDLTPPLNKYGLFEYWCLHLTTGMLPVEYFNWGGAETPFLFKYRAVNSFRLNFADQAINNGKPVEILEDKKNFNNHFDEYLQRAWFHDESSARSFFLTHSEFIAKPVGNYGGKGIFIMDLSDVECVEEKIDKCKELNLLGGEYICEQLIKQKGLLNKIHPQSVNTLRVVSLYDDRKDQVKILSSFFRTGNDGSLADNFSSGGVLWLVDVSEGSILFGTKNNGVCVSRHPNSDINMRGLLIPRYQEALSMCIEAHTKVKEIPLIGWDVVISEDFISLVEGNAGPGFRNTNPKAWEDIKEYIIERNLSIPKIRWY